MTVPDPTSCPCGTGLAYPGCCGPVHRGDSDAVTAERLMRARFSAFALADEAYLLRSWHPSTRPEHVEFDPDLRWTDLQILGTTDGGLFADEGTVEFMAHYDRAGQAGSLHELSRFVRSGQRWVYLDAVDADLS